MIDSIVVPLDGSEFGEKALPLACTIGSAGHAVLNLVHVHVPQPAPTPLEAFTPYAFEHAQTSTRSFDAEVRLQEREYLEDIAARLQPGCGCRVQQMIVDGATDSGIEAAVAALDADLIVMSTHARGLLGRIWAGSVADEVLHDVTIPILLVHPSAAAGMAGTGAVRTIVVALDGSLLSDAIVPVVRDLASALHARIVLVSVLDPRTRHIAPAAATPFGAEAHALEHDDLLAHVTDVRDRLAGTGEVEMRLAVHQDPVTAIAEIAHAEHASIVALATHGREGIARLLNGSVADRLLRECSSPLLLIRPGRSR